MIRVIIAEDEEILRQGLVKVLPWEECGCEVVGDAGNALEAIRLAERFHPEIVVTDIRMPGMNGLDMIARIRDVCPCEAVVLSGYDEFAYAKQAIALGVAGYLLKPVDDAEFIATLRKAVCRVREWNTGALPTASGLELDPKGSSAMNETHLAEATGYIAIHYSENITLRDVARAVLISESYLSKLFRNVMDCSFLEYLTRVRIDRAKELLQKPYRIYEVGRMVGYQDVRHFYAVFKKMVGVTPKEYRNHPGKR